MTKLECGMRLAYPINIAVSSQLFYWIKWFSVIQQTLIAKVQRVSTHKFIHFKLSIDSKNWHLKISNFKMDIKASHFIYVMCASLITLIDNTKSTCFFSWKWLSVLQLVVIDFIRIQSMNMYWYYQMPMCESKNKINFVK